MAIRPRNGFLSKRFPVTAMAIKIRSALPFVLILCVAFAARAQDAASSDAAAAPAAKDVPDLKVGTKAFDAKEVAEIYAKTKRENERRARAEAPHLNMDHLEMVELAPFEVQANSLRNYDALLDKIDPQPRRRLQRLAELDPEAAFDLQVSMRSEERFFAGEADNTFDSNIGRTADFDAIALTKKIANAIKKDEPVGPDGKPIEESR